jgi:RNA polymerase sigma-70 factor (ECF subfamily)
VIRRRDPLDRPEELIRRVYAYVAYRIGDGADAEDVTSDTFERALRYRSSYDPSRGEPIAWLIGIARHCIRDAATAQTAPMHEAEAPGEELESVVIRRVELAAALSRLGSHDRELLALRYGADLTARGTAEVLGMRTNAVEVALHRARARLRAELESGSDTEPAAAGSHVEVEAV